MFHLESHNINPQHIQLRLTILLTQNHVDRIALPHHGWVDILLPTIQLAHDETAIVTLP